MLNIRKDELFVEFPSLPVSEDPEVVLDPLKQASEELQLLEVCY